MTSWIRIRDHFITKRCLAREKAELKAIVVKQDALLAAKDEELREYDRALTALRDSFDRTRISRELAEVIREEAAAKRQQDGLGDPR